MSMDRREFLQVLAVAAAAGLPIASRDALAAAPVAIDYPVLEYPPKPQSLNLDKTPLIEGALLGIKGQYLILDCGVLNVRNFTAYHVRLAAA